MRPGAIPAETIAAQSRYEAQGEMALMLGIQGTNLEVLRETTRMPVGRSSVARWSHSRQADRRSTLYPIWTRPRASLGMAAASPILGVWGDRMATFCGVSIDCFRLVSRLVFGTVDRFGARRNGVGFSALRY